MSFRRREYHHTIYRKDRLKYRLRNVPNNRYTHAVPANMIGVIVALGQTITIVQSHQPCGLTW